MAGISKRRWISLILCFVLLLGAFSTYDVKAEQKPLWILTDFYIDRRPACAENNKESFFQHLKYVTGLEPEEIKLEYLPQDKESLNVRLASLRIELMAGDGPDVFLLSCNIPWGKERKAFWDSLVTTPIHQTKNAAQQRERLFLDPQKAMENRILLPLDQYIKTARWLDPDLIHPVIWEAGRTKNGQMILPLTFTFPAAVYAENSFHQEKAESCAFGGTAWNQFPDLFGRLADYSNRKLLFSREELLETVQTALGSIEKESAQQVAFENQLEKIEYFGDQFFFPEKTGGLLSVGSIAHGYDGMCGMGLLQWTPDRYANWAEDASSQKIAPVHNREGGVTAEITSYACININTKRPKDAFLFLDFLWKDEVQSGAGDFDVSQQRGGQTWLFCNSFGIPARNDLMRDLSTAFDSCYIGALHPNYSPEFQPEAADTLFATYTSLRNEITTARFYGSLDVELQTMFNQCREAKTDEEIEKIVSRSYDTMTIMLGE